MRLVTLKDKFPHRSRSTRHRWRNNTSLGLPAPAKIIGGVAYYDEDQLDRWQPPTSPTAAGPGSKATAEEPGLVPGRAVSHVTQVASEQKARPPPPDTG